MGHSLDPSSAPIPSVIPSASSKASGSVGRRQRRGSSMRANRWCVRASDADASVILGKADKAGVSVPRLLVSLAVDSSVRSSVERKGTVSVLVGLSRQLAGVGTNLNQLARHANAMGELGDAGRLDEALGSVEVLRAELESVLAEVK